MDAETLTVDVVENGRSVIYLVHYECGITLEQKK